MTGSEILKYVRHHDKTRLVEFLRHKRNSSCEFVVSKEYYVLQTNWYFPENIGGSTM